MPPGNRPIRHHVRARAAVRLIGGDRPSAPIVLPDAPTPPPKNRVPPPSSNRYCCLSCAYSGCFFSFSLSCSLLTYIYIYTRTFPSSLTAGHKSIGLGVRFSGRWPRPASASAAAVDDDDDDRTAVRPTRPPNALENRYVVVVRDPTARRPAVVQRIGETPPSHRSISCPRARLRSYGVIDRSGAKRVSVPRVECPTGVTRVVQRNRVKAVHEDFTDNSNGRRRTRGCKPLCDAIPFRKRLNERIFRPFFYTFTPKMSHFPHPCFSALTVCILRVRCSTRSIVSRIFTSGSLADNATLRRSVSLCRP